MKKRLIGKVQLTYLDNHIEKKYQDSSEEFLHKFFKEKPESERTDDINKLLNNKPSWDLYYNLIPQRKHILDWYPFNKKGKLLEIGAGTGAVTGLLTDRVKEVTALELSPIRSEILAYRLRDKNNLKVISGNFLSYDIKKKNNFYDYIVMIGVLEYSDLFSKEKKLNFNKAYLYLMNNIFSLLKKGGTLFLAIENPIGIRYFSGAVEDHYGELFEGIENYPQYTGIRTYTKNQLKNIFLKMGFKDPEFYLAYPDYKIPRLVIQEDYLNNYDHSSLSSLYSNIDLAYPLFHFFSEVMFSFQLRKERLLSTFANSFLIVAKK